MHSYLIMLLACPACHGELRWTITEGSGDRIETASIRCTGCGARYEVREGIGMFLTPELAREDLWQETESRISKYLQEHPEIERQLMEAPLEELAPADQFFRAQVLEERGRYAEAQKCDEVSRKGIYTEDYLQCSDNQINATLAYLSGCEGPIVDLASGRGILIEEMARALPNPLVASDFSPLVLRRNRRRFEYAGIYDRINLLAFDARRTPFKDEAVPTLTTYQGLQNIRRPGDVLTELRRVASGCLLSLSIFLPQGDAKNQVAVESFGLSDHFLLTPTYHSLEKTGWQAEVIESCIGRALPTPYGDLLRGAVIDVMPVVATTFHWCVMVCTKDPSF